MSESFSVLESTSTEALTHEAVSSISTGVSFDKSLCFALVALLVGSLLIAYQTAGGLTKNSKRNSQATFIIVGPQGSGKTSLFRALTGSKPNETINPREPNVHQSVSIPFDSPTDATRVTVVDIPGPAKLFGMFKQSVIENSNIKGVLFVLDSTECSGKGFEQTAQYLFRVLLRTEHRGGGIDVMIACNKADMANAMPATELRVALQKRLTEIRDSKPGKTISGQTISGTKHRFENTTSTGTGDDEFDETGDGNWFGNEGLIDFAQLDGEVSLAEGSVVGNKIESWKRWMETASLN